MNLYSGTHERIQNEDTAFRFTKESMEEIRRSFTELLHGSLRESCTFNLTN